MSLRQFAGNGQQTRISFENKDQPTICFQVRLIIWHLSLIGILGKCWKMSKQFFWCRLGTKWFSVQWVLLPHNILRSWAQKLHISICISVFCPRCRPLIQSFSKSFSYPTRTASVHISQSPSQDASTQTDSANSSSKFARTFSVLGGKRGSKHIDDEVMQLIDSCRRYQVGSPTIFKGFSMLEWE